MKFSITEHIRLKFIGLLIVIVIEVWMKPIKFL